MVKNRPFRGQKFSAFLVLRTFRVNGNIDYVLDKKHGYSVCQW